MKIIQASLLIAASPLVVGAMPPEEMPAIATEAALKAGADIGRIANAAEKVAKAEKTQAEQDYAAASLKAQQDSAQWALIALIISVVQGFVAIVGLLWVKKTLDATRDAVDAASAANVIASDGVVAAKESTEAQLRAWLTLDVKLTHCSKSDSFTHFSVAIKTKNIGATPALDIKCESSVHLETQVRMHPPSATRLSGLGGIMHPLMPNEETGNVYGKRLDNSDIEAAYSKATNYDIPIVVLDVRLTYKTAFDKVELPCRETSARFIITPRWGNDGKREWLQNEMLERDHVELTRDDFGPAIVT